MSNEHTSYGWAQDHEVRCEAEKEPGLTFGQTLRLPATTRSIRSAGPPQKSDRKRPCAGDTKSYR